MASVRKREGKRGVSWICDYTTPDGKRKRKTFKMKKHAVSYMNKVGVDINEGTYVDPEHYKKQTLKMLLTDYENNFKHQLGFDTSKKYHLDVIRNKLGEDTRLMQINFKDLETFRNELKQTPTKSGKERSDASVNRCMAALRHMMRKAVSWDNLGNAYSALGHFHNFCQVGPRAWYAAAILFWLLGLGNKENAVLQYDKDFGWVIIC